MTTVALSRYILSILNLHVYIQMLAFISNETRLQPPMADCQESKYCSRNDIYSNITRDCYIPKTQVHHTITVPGPRLRAKMNRGTARTRMETETET